MVRCLPNGSALAKRSELNVWQVPVQGNSRKKTCWQDGTYGISSEILGKYEAHVPATVQIGPLAHHTFLKRARRCLH